MASSINSRLPVPREGTISSSCEKSDHVTESRAAITVRDDGKGLSPDESEAALGRFSQLEPSEGSGLGLAIAASVAARHDGSLLINSVDKGASLTLRLKTTA